MRSAVRPSAFLAKRGIELWPKRLDAEPLEMGMSRHLGRRDEAHVPEPARIVVGDGGTGLGLDDDMVVGRIVAGRMGELAELGAVGAARHRDREAPGHAEVDRQHLARVEMAEDVLGAPLEPLDRPPLEAL